MWAATAASLVDCAWVRLTSAEVWCVCVYVCGSRTVACQVLISRVWGCAGPKFPFQEKHGQKEKPKKEGKQLARKNKWARLADGLVQAFFFFSPKCRWNWIKVACVWKVDGLFGQTVLLLSPFRSRCTFASSLTLTNHFLKICTGKLKLFPCWKFKKTSLSETTLMSSLESAASSAASKLPGGISSSRLLEKQKIAAVTVSNAGIGRGFESLPRAGTENVRQNSSEHIRRCSRCSRGERKFHLKRVPVFQTRCNHSAKNNIKCRFSLCWRAAAREAITYWNLLVIHVVYAEKLAFILICIHIFTVKKSLKIQFLYIFLQFGFIYRPALWWRPFFFFSSVVPVTAGFLFPPPHRSGWHTCRKERKSLPKRCILDLNFAPPSRRFVSFTGIWFIRGGGGEGEVPGKEPTRHTWSFYLKTGLKTLGRSAEPWGRSHTCLTPWRRKTARRVCMRFLLTWRQECCFFWRVSTANKSETSQV